MKQQYILIITISGVIHDCIGLVTPRSHGRKLMSIIKYET